MLTASDDGATVIATPGQVVIVVLRGQGMLTWNRPRVAGLMPGALRQLSARGGYLSMAAAQARYRVVKAGTATIVSGTNARCLHAHPPCAIPQRAWQVTVVVR
jgi:hypothetical protein